VRISARVPSSCKITYRNISNYLVWRGRRLSALSDPPPFPKHVSGRSMMQSLGDASNHFTFTIYEWLVPVLRGREIYIPRHREFSKSIFLSFWISYFLIFFPLVFEVRHCISASYLLQKDAYQYWIDLPIACNGFFGSEWNKICGQDTTSYDELDLHGWHESVAWVSQTSARSDRLAKSERDLDIPEHYRHERCSSVWTTLTKWGFGTFLLRKWSFR
jgi:hypothetical protein